MTLKTPRTLAVYASQIVWQFLFVLSATYWRGIPSIPYFAKASEVLDRTRWFWLVAVPKPSLANTSLIISVVHSIAFAEIIICIALIYIYLKYIWKYSNTIVKSISVVVVMIGLIVSLVFEHRMYANFIDMSEYYYLWQSIFSIEVYSVIALVLWIFKITTSKTMGRNR